MIFKDYYKILGLDTNKVSFDEIKVAFREQAKKYHPDVNGQNTKTEERFKDINEAYTILSKAATKRKYDRMWNAKIGRKKKKQNAEKNRQANTSATSEFTNIFFGRKKEETNENKIYKKIPLKGENIETEIDVKLEDAYFGIEKKVSLKAVNRKDENILNQSSCRN